MNVNQSIRSMVRKSHNGYETTISMHYVGNYEYRWELIRYPLDISCLDEPTEIVIIFHQHGRRDPDYWPRALAQVSDYLRRHPEDGFAAS